MKRFVTIATSSVVLVAALAMALVAGNAHAQITSTPPTLMGQRSFHLYSVPGVIMRFDLGTFFACTNMTSANIRVGVELFSQVGGPAMNDPSLTSLDINPGGTVFFGTSPAVAIPVDSILGGGTDGSARILATKATGIICNAFVADCASSPPTSMADLKVVKKTTQKGD
jgi:hypothetical protein